MKKLLLIIAAIFTLNSVHADLILHESFDREVGKLNSGAIPSTTITDTENWYTKNTNAKNIITVAEGSLSYPDYVTTGTGNKALLITANTSLSSDMRMLKTSVSKGKVYLSAIINVDELNKTDEATTTTSAYCLALGKGTTSMSEQYTRLYIRSVKDGDNYVGFKMGVTKNNEVGGGIPFTETIYTEKTDYLVVLEYEFIDGDMNDVARLYVNPAKSTTPPTPTLICTQSFINANNVEQGAKAKNDASEIKSVFLNEVAKYNPNRLFVDEIKVATSWEDLFGEGGDTPVEEPAEINVSTKTLSFASGMPFTGEAYTATFTVTGKNLKGDITLTSDNAELTLDKTTIAKADAETEAGVTVTATLTPVKLDGQKANITLTTDGATATITSSWWTTDVKECNTVAELKTQAATASGYEYAYMRFTGEAIVTYKYAKENGETVLYLEDNTAAISITDTYWGDAVKQGDKVTGFGAYTYADAAVGGVLPITPLSTTITILSSNNEVTPQTVTLAELQKNPLDYLLELVKVVDVTLDQTSTKFGQKTQDEQASLIPDYITQNGTQAKIQLQDGNELIGTTKPNKADITGISTNTQGNSICVRGAADVISKDNPTAIDNVAMDELLSGEYEVYTVSGQRIDALQPGVNIIRKGNTTYKVVR